MNQTQTIPANQPHLLSSLPGTIKKGIVSTAGIVKKKAADAVALSGTVKRKIISTAVEVKKKADDALALSGEIKKNIKISALALRIILANREIRDEIASAVKSATDVSKKSIEEARDGILKDKVFLNNLTNTSKKIGDQLSNTVYSTVDGASLGAVSDIRAVYSSFSATLNAIDLFSSILKVPVTKLDEKIKGDSKEVISLFKSLISVKNNYYATMKKLNDDMKLAAASLAVPSLPIPNLNIPKLNVPMPKVNIPKVNIPKVNVPIPKLNVPMPKVNVPKVNVPKVNVPIPKLNVPMPKVNVPKVSIPKVKSGGGSSKKKKTIKRSRRRYRNKRTLKM
jgi:hypothetical protein